MREIPFYENSKDNVHCFQACLRSVLKYYFPNKDYGFKYLDRMVNYKKGKWTWNSAALLFLSKMGFEVIVIEDFDYKEFGRLGEKYLKDNWTIEMFETQKKFSDLKSEQKFAKLIARDEEIKLIERPAMLKDLKDLFKKDFMILCSINPYILDGEKQYGSHMILVTDISMTEIAFHDPGLPPNKNRKVPIKLFLKAMRYPHRNNASIIAVKFCS